jgi:tungstate transport system substrate-binding protein
MLAACSPKASNPPAPTAPQARTPLRLATTTSTFDSGLLDVLVPAFEAKYPYDVQVLSKGTGEAIALGRTGDADVLLVHARSQEDQFMADGQGKERRDVCYNDFLVVGPAADPAGIKGLAAVPAFQKMAEANAVFISRGDNSGTHTKEKSVWAAANIADKGTGYLEAGTGMAAVLRMANEKSAYTLTDRATYLSLKGELTNLAPLVEGDTSLFNPYGVITVNPDNHNGINYDGAKAFMDWITSTEGQDMIKSFGIDKYGQSLFVPDYKG